MLVKERKAVYCNDGFYRCSRWGNYRLQADNSPNRVRQLHCCCWIVCSAQDASKNKNDDAYSKFVESAWQSARHCTIRGQFDFNFLAEPLPLSEVESAASIVKRFVTGESASSSASSPVSRTFAHRCDVLLVSQHVQVQ